MQIYDHQFRDCITCTRLWHTTQSVDSGLKLFSSIWKPPCTFHKSTVPKFSERDLWHFTNTRNCITCTFIITRVPRFDSIRTYLITPSFESQTESLWTDLRNISKIFWLCTEKWNDRTRDKYYTCTYRKASRALFLHKLSISSTNWFPP